MDYGIFVHALLKTLADFVLITYIGMMKEKFWKTLQPNSFLKKSKKLICHWSKINHHNTGFSMSGNLNLQYSRTDHLKNSFSSIGAKIWNSVLNSDRNLPKYQFKDISYTFVLFHLLCNLCTPCHFNLICWCLVHLFS